MHTLRLITKRRVSNRASHAEVTPPPPLLLPTTAASPGAAQDRSRASSFTEEIPKAGVRAKPRTAMAENAGLENHRIKSFKNKGRDVEVSLHVNVCAV